jgi:hypothetical protein
LLVNDIIQGYKILMLLSSQAGRAISAGGSRSGVFRPPSRGFDRFFRSN